MRNLKINQEVIIKTLSLEYCDYNNIKGRIISIDSDYTGATIAVPEKSFSMEDERDLIKKDGKVIIHVKEENLF